MDHQKTTHILLTIAVVGILFLIYLFMQERYFNKPTLSYQPITEEPVYVPPVNNPVNPPITNPAPVPNNGPTFNPNNRSLTTANISRGDLLNLTYTTVDNSGMLYAFCEKMINTNIWHFAYYDDQYCENDEKVMSVDTKALRVLLKPEYDIDDLNRLNALYGVETKTDGFMNGGHMEYWLKISSQNNYDSIALARVYFETGYFRVAQPLFSPLITGEDN